MTIQCSFCGAGQHEVAAIVAGPAVFICNECVSHCGEIIREKLNEGATAEPTFQEMGANWRTDDFDRGFAVGHLMGAQ